MNNLSSVFLSCVLAATGLLMMALGVLFVHSVVLSSHRGEGVFTLLLLSIILLLTGGGLISSTVAESFRQLRHKP